jgi:hypothetical protein
MNNLELAVPITDKMILENLIDEKNREIEKLKNDIAKLPKLLTAMERIEHFWNCGNISETIDKMEELGYVKPEPVGQ